MFLSKSFFKHPDRVESDVATGGADHRQRWQPIPVFRRFLRAHSLKQHRFFGEGPFGLTARRTALKRVPFDDLSETFEIIDHEA